MEQEKSHQQQRIKFSDFVLVAISYFISRCPYSIHHGVNESSVKRKNPIDISITISSTGLIFHLVMQVLLNLRSDR
jgi:hypothetical protein